MSRGMPSGPSLAEKAADLARIQKERDAEAKAKESQYQHDLATALAKQAERNAATNRVEAAGLHLFTFDPERQQPGIKRSLHFILSWDVPAKDVPSELIEEWTQAVEQACRLIRSQEHYEDYRDLNRTGFLDHLAYHTDLHPDTPADRVPRDEVGGLLDIAFGLLDGMFAGVASHPVVAEVWQLTPLAIQFAHNILVGLYHSCPSFPNSRTPLPWSFVRDYLPRSEPADGIHAPLPGAQGIWKWYTMYFRKSRPPGGFPFDLWQLYYQKMRSDHLKQLSDYLVDCDFVSTIETLSPEGIGGRKLAVSLLKQAVKVVKHDRSRKAWDGDPELRQLLGEINDETNPTTIHAWDVLSEGLKKEVLDRKNRGGTTRRTRGAQPKKAIDTVLKNRIIDCYKKGTTDPETIWGLVGGQDNGLEIEDVSRTIATYRRSQQPSRQKGKSARTNRR